MKNIHVLKTDKPSRLLKDLVDETYQFKKEVLYGNRFELPLNIYITSDEDIKEGDWIFDLDTKRIVKADGFKVTTSKKSQCWYYKKIILTTDQDLIKDGVQAIDDEFLEWFVKNPNCEDVEVEIICGVCGVEGREDEIDVCGRSKECARGWISDKYKIIIPRKIIQIYKINDLKEAFLKGYVAKNNKEDYPFAVQKFLNSKLNENKK